MLLTRQSILSLTGVELVSMGPADGWPLNARAFCEFWQSAAARKISSFNSGQVLFTIHKVTAPASREIMFLKAGLALT